MQRSSVSSKPSAPHNQVVSTLGSITSRESRCSTRCPSGTCPGGISSAPATPTRAQQKQPRAIPTAVASRDLADDLSRVLSPVLRRAPLAAPVGKAAVVSVGPESAMIGVDIKNEKRAAVDRSRSRNIPAAIVMPLRETPGMIAKACATPIDMASANDIVPMCFCLAPRISANRITNPIPIAIVPGHLSDEDLDTLS